MYKNCGQKERNVIFNKMCDQIKEGISSKISGDKNCYQKKTSLLRILYVGKLQIGTDGLKLARAKVQR